MFFLKDTDSDDRADVVKKINSGWGTGDKHGGPSNLRYGLDNRIYGCVGGGGHWDERGRFSAEQVWVGNTVVLFSDDHLRLQRDKDR